MKRSSLLNFTFAIAALGVITPLAPSSVKALEIGTEVASKEGFGAAFLDWADNNMRLPTHSHNASLAFCAFDGEHILYKNPRDEVERLEAYEKCKGHFVAVRPGGSEIHYDQKVHNNYDSCYTQSMQMGIRLKLPVVSTGELTGPR